MNRFTRIASVLVASAVAPFATARAQLPAPPRTTVIFGEVTDSISGQPLDGAVVQLAHADSVTGGPSSAISDPDGHFRLAGVPLGRYVIAFVHPALDSLQLDARGVPLDVRSRDSVHAELSTPSAATIRTIYCGRGALADSDRTGLLIGTVHAPRNGAPVPGARVTARASTVAVRKGRLVFDTLGADARTSAFGAYVICGLPSQEAVSLVASDDSGASTAFETAFPTSGIAIRDIYLGVPGVMGILRGRVVNPSGEPLAGARVIGPAPTRVAIADASGRFTMPGVPSGTHAFTIHAIGSKPDEWLIDVIGDTLTRIFTMYPATSLDTLRIVARKMTVEQAEFLHRRASGFGTVFGHKDVDRYGPFETTDLLRRVPGLRIVQGASSGQDVLRVRGGDCLPTFILDGRNVALFESLDEINVLVKPQEIQAMEVYNGAYNPLGLMTNGFCATILVWTKAEMGAAVAQ